MIRVLDKDGARKLDAFMMQQGQPGFLLMENAANALLNEILVLPQISPVLILCGGGNNGGDGIALYRKLKERDIESEIVFLSDPCMLSGDAKLNFDILLKARLPYTFISDSAQLQGIFYSKRFSLIVDALFGTGLSKPVSSIYKDAIEIANDYPAYRLAVDIPSGVDADTGHILGTAFHADKTVTFQTAKRGHMLFPGREFCGESVTLPIGLATDHNYTVQEFTLEKSDIKKLLPKRPLNSHKGDNGRGLIFAGCARMPGAAVMSASAALRSGAGLIKVCAHKNACDALNTRVPEAMTHEAVSWADFSSFDLLSWADAFAIGPGMGDEGAIADILRRVLETKKPTVIDADGINTLSKHDELKSMLHDRVILTPHPGEMQRLSGDDAEYIKNYPHCSAQSFARKYNTTVLLKGATSVICDHCGTVYYNKNGNPGLAKGGSGDVLTGIILAMLLEGLDAGLASAVGAYILGSAADTALSKCAERSLMARDVIDAIRYTL